MKCPFCKSNLGKGITLNFTDLARLRIRRYICPKCHSKVVVKADTNEIIEHMTVEQL